MTQRSCTTCCLKLMRIEIKSVDPALASPSWEWLPDGCLKILLPDYGQRTDYERLLAIQKIIEAIFCRREELDWIDVSDWMARHADVEQAGDHPDAPNYLAYGFANMVTRMVSQGLKLDWDGYRRWARNAAAETYRPHQPLPEVTARGPLFWAELHLFAARNEGKGRLLHEWFTGWYNDLPFDGCPCKEHADRWVSENPPDYLRFFEWSVRFHNSVNERLGRPILSLEGASKLWSRRTF